MTSYNFCISPPTLELEKAIGNLCFDRTVEIIYVGVGSTFNVPIFEASTHANFLPLVVGAVPNDRAEHPSKSTSFPPFPWFQQYKKLFTSACHAAWSIVMISLCQELVREGEENKPRLNSRTWVTYVTLLWAFLTSHTILAIKLNRGDWLIQFVIAHDVYCHFEFKIGVHMQKVYKVKVGILFPYIWYTCPHNRPKLNHICVRLGLASPTPPSLSSLPTHACVGTLPRWESNVTILYHLSH